ncbi:MAG: anthranilate synthase component I [Mycobacteriaceae bacterium]
MQAPLGVTSPDLEQFRVLAAEHRVVPVTRRLLADAETPVSAYRKLAADRPGTFLLESAETGRSWSRWSFIGAGSPAALTVVDGEAVWQGTVPAGVPSGGDPLRVLRAVGELLHTERLPGLPPLTGGMVGYLGYDVVRRLEHLPTSAVDDLHLPEVVMLLATDLAAVDHHEGTITLIANAVNWDGSDDRVEAAHADAVARLDAMADALAAPSPSTVTRFDRPEPRYRRARTPEQHQSGVRSLIADIEAGEAFQVVLSQRFEMDTDADPLDVYRVLRASNPSPYMYLLRVPDGDGGTAFDIVGSSPEALVTVVDGTATTHPIAGTRWRGETPEEDELLEKELRHDEKENAEHLMLVDLGRNDLGRVCEAGSVRVTQYRHVERYSHVMHLVSTVTGRLGAGATALDAVTACFPAGTLSGAPKPRALELIEALEPTRRGVYGGIVGYLDFAGDADTAIAIRTAVIKDGTAYVQAGGGVVADSDPAAEDAETQNKAMAVLAAVAAAGTMRPAGAGAGAQPQDRRG